MLYRLPLLMVCCVFVTANISMAGSISSKHKKKRETIVVSEGEEVQPYTGSYVSFPSRQEVSSSSALPVAVAYPISSLGYHENIRKYDIPVQMRKKHEEDFRAYSWPYEDALRNLQVVLIVDHSGSQGASDQYPHGSRAPSGMLRSTWTQWDNTYMVTRYLAESILEYDKDGRIPVIFFSSQVTDKLISDVGDLLDKFRTYRPGGSTNLLGALDLAFSRYMPNSQERGLFIVLTDGQPDAWQENQIRNLIEEKLSRVDPQGEYLNVMFIRIGDDPNAIRFLKYLDDCPEIGKNVDTKSDNRVYEMGPKNMILNAIFEHLDNVYQD